jgi:hypothetical protein
MSREKVTLRVNQPELITLDRDSSSPAPRNGNQPQQYMRILDSDTRILFADAELENEIVRSGARSGDVVQIIKRSNGWEVGIMPNTHVRQAPQPQTYSSYAASNPPQQLAPPAAQQPAEIKGHRTMELVVALENAIDAAIAAERYAASKGHPIAFETSDIRAMANSIICREGGR